jgi:ABC-type proline/glycine betaine transport system permease subunit
VATQGGEEANTFRHMVAHRLKQARVLWLVPLLLALHNAEEAAFFPEYLPLVLAKLPATWQATAGPITLGQVWGALGVVTLIPLGIAAWAVWRESTVALWLLLLVQATVLLNVFWHVSAAALFFNGYAPGLVTAVALNLPFSIYLLRRAAREEWVGSRARWALLPGALVLHGPALSAVLLLTERL